MNILNLTQVQRKSILKDETIMKEMYENKFHKQKDLNWKEVVSHV